jgi:hypothetical protein
MKFERKHMRSAVLAILLAGAWTTGCGAESPEVPEDADEGGTNAGGTAGAATGGVSGAATGGAFPMGGAPTGGATTGGAFPTGGAAGTAVGGAAGSGTGTCGITAAGDASIDDLEDGENGIKMPRVGYWYTYNDMTAGCAQMPAPDPTGMTPFLPTAAAGNGMYAAHTSGGACATWGAGMGFDLANCNSTSGVYDATAFNGLSFYYKSTTPLRVIIATTDVIPTTRPPGTCVPGAAGSMMECDNGHGMDLAAAPAGMMTSVSFATLNQVFGQMKPFNKAHIVNIQWQVIQGMAFDFTIDDVAFTP